MNNENYYEYIVIGGGISGLSSLEFLKTKSDNILLLEKKDKVGGWVSSSQQDKYIFETGPNSFLKSYQHVYDLIKMINLEDQVIYNHPENSKRFIYRNGKIHSLPEKPQHFFSTKLLSTSAKLRFLLEPFIKPANKNEESVRSFGNRRFGKEITSIMLDSMISGICVGDIDKLDIHSLFPKITSIERDYKSLIRFLIKFKKKTEQQTHKHEGMFLSLNQGMGQITSHIFNRNKDKIKTGIVISKVEQQKDRSFQIETDQNQSFFCKNIIFASPSYETASLIAPIDQEIADTLNTVTYKNVVTLSFIFKKNKVNHPLDGFGFLIPRNQDRRILGGLFSSSLFPNRCPSDEVLIKVYIGGAHDEQVVNLKDEEIKNIALKEIKEILSIQDDPLFIKINRIKNAIPQLNIGHFKFKENLKRQLGNHPNIKIVGNFIDGISVDASVKCSKDACSNF